MHTKLKDILIEAGKEATKISSTPWMGDIESEHEKFIKAMARDDLRSMRTHGIKLIAMVIKGVTDKC